MKVYARADGTIVCVLRSTVFMAQPPTDPAEQVYTLEFDPATNQAAAAILTNRPENCRLVDGTLTYQDQSVTISAPSAAFQDMLDFAATRDKLAVGGALTAAELRIVLRRLIARVAALDGKNQ